MCLRRPFSTGLITLCGGEPVTLQAMEEEPPLLAKCKDKFMVQSVALPPGKEALTQPDIVSSNSFRSSQPFTLLLTSGSPSLARVTLLLT